MAKNAFKLIADAKPTDGGNIIRDGNYRFLIEKVTLDDKFTGTIFVAELRVISAESSGTLDANGKPTVPNPVGSTASLVCNFSKHPDVAPNSAKKFLIGACLGLGFTEEQIDEDLSAKLCGPENPLFGVAVEDNTYITLNKGRTTPENRGKPITNHKWKPVVQTQEELLAQRKFLTSTPARAAVTETAPAQTAPAAERQATAVAANPLASILGLK